ncbi:hypothetical protein F5X99DRAFT_423864 [Biscogniauxia marginata]|nr:hypothetical protein F5X99DRAFT_423864 [Biscogniauxia marginata]
MSRRRRTTTTTRHLHLPPPLLLLLLLTFLTLPPLASPTPLQILDNSTLYAYAGCFNETTTLPGTTRQRALAGGAQQTLPGAMTVPLCLGFCADGGGGGGGADAGGHRFAYAGLEYSRECWCADALSALSARLDDGECDDPCDGDPATACGGALRLSLYNLTDEARSGGGGGRRGWRRRGGGLWESLGPVLGIGLALWVL